MVQHLLHRHSLYEDWDTVQVEVDIRVEDLNLIRITAPGHIIIMCQVYAYMRDGVDGGWKSDELVRTSLVSLTRRLDSVDVGAKVKSADIERCSHCHSYHYYNKRKLQCPWKALSSEEAMAKARELLGVDSRKKKTSESDGPP